MDGEAPLAAINASLKERKEALGGKKVKGASSYPSAATCHHGAAVMRAAQAGVAMQPACSGTRFSLLLTAAL